MAYTSGFFDAVDQGGGDYDRVYSASSFAHYFSLLVKNGVFPDPSTGMQVKASSNPDMHVSVQPGSGWVNGYYITVENNAPEQLTIPTANPSLSRIDSVIMGLNYVDREIQLYIKSGAVSASPSAVSLQRDNDLYELELAQITVGAGVASISQASITDMRQNTSRCGIVAGTIDQIDTTDLFAQYDTAFQTWFDNLKAQLSDNVVTNLQNQINTLKTDKVNVSDKASIEQAQAGTDDGTWMSPSLVNAEIGALSYYRNQILSEITKSILNGTANMTPDDAFRELSDRISIYKHIEQFGSAGAYTFTVPKNIHHLLVFVVSGGDSGSAMKSTFRGTYTYAGGNSGNLGVFRFDVTPGDSIPLVVGAGGKAVSSTSEYKAGNAGGASSFNGKAVSGSLFEGIFNRTKGAPNLNNNDAYSIRKSCIFEAMVSLMYFMYGEENLLTNLSAGGSAEVNSSNVVRTQESVTFSNGKKSSASAGGESSATASKGTDYGCGGGSVIVATSSSATAKSAEGMNGVVDIWGY